MKCSLVYLMLISCFLPFWMCSFCHVITFECQLITRTFHDDVHATVDCGHTGSYELLSVMEINKSLALSFCTGA